MGACRSVIGRKRRESGGKKGPKNEKRSDEKWTWGNASHRQKTRKNSTEPAPLGRITNMTTARL